MTKPCEEYHDLMSGYLDDELASDDRIQLEEHVAGCAACRAELDAMSDLVAASNELTVDMPPDEVWDDFLDNVYHRIERRTGWLLFTVGVVALACWGIYYMVVTDWASPAVKLASEGALIGISILFISVLRQRLLIRKHDRYSRDVKR